MLSWIPILGPIIDGIAKIFKGFTDTKIATIEADVAVTKAVAQTAQAYHDDPGFRLLRDLALAPAVVWVAVFGWDNLVVYNWPHLFWPVAPWKGLEWYPYAALTSLFGLNLMSMWKR